jgi:pyridinium-3,5-bisthiocarboxylic acid mononucleotide nickel chelatase
MNRDLDIHLDLIGGLSGDMFVAGLVDLTPNLEPRLEQNLRLCGPSLEGVSCKVETVGDGTFVGKRFHVERSRARAARDHEAEHGHAHGHPHVDWRLIRRELEASALNPAVRRRALAIFSLLAEAEARIHGCDVEDVQFHEVGAWDSVADIVSAAFLIEESGAASWTVGTIPLGAGRVRTAHHGLLPIPAPATALLLEGFPFVDDGVSGERVTPTGAAIVRNLVQNTARSNAPRRLIRAGVGFGMRTLPGLSNCVRFLRFEKVGANPVTNDVLVIEFEVDDQSAEDLALALDRLRARSDVYDIVQTPVFGKKGRLTASIRLLGDPAGLDDIAAQCFEETATIGLRHRVESRIILPRETRVATVDEREVRLKVVKRPSSLSIKVEADDLAATPGRLAREDLRRKAERDKED